MAVDVILFNIDRELKKQFQIAVIKNGTDMTSVLLKAVREYINGTKVTKNNK